MTDNSACNCEQALDLMGILRKHGICEDCAQFYEHNYDEPIASCGCKQSEWTEFTQFQQVKLERNQLIDLLIADYSSIDDFITAKNALLEQIL